MILEITAAMMPTLITKLIFKNLSSSSKVNSLKRETQNSVQTRVEKIYNKLPENGKDLK